MNVRQPRWVHLVSTPSKRGLMLPTSLPTAAHVGPGPSALAPLGSQGPTPSPSTGTPRNDDQSPSVAPTPTATGP